MNAVYTPAVVLLLFVLVWLRGTYVRAHRQRTNGKLAQRARIQAVLTKITEHTEALEIKAAKMAITTETLEAWASPSGVRPYQGICTPTPDHCPHDQLRTPRVCASCGHDPNYQWLAVPTFGMPVRYIKGSCRHLVTDVIQVCEWAPWLNGEIVGRLCLNCEKRLEDAGPDGH